MTSIQQLVVFLLLIRSVVVLEVRQFRLRINVKSLDTFGTRNTVTTYICAMYRRNDWLRSSTFMVTECAPAGYEEFIGGLARANQKWRNILDE